MAKKGLGKGLEALFEENQVDVTQAVSVLRITDIEPNKNQPRRLFDDASINELAESIKKHGIIQPIIVRLIDGESNRYQIIAGERRWKAARIAGLTEVPVVVREESEADAYIVTLIENLQREDLNNIEEAEGYRILAEQYNMTQDDIAKSVGKARTTVTNILRLLNLPSEIQKMIIDGELTQGQARPLLTLPNVKAMLEIAEIIKNKGLSVRAVEKLIKEYLDNLSQLNAGNKNKSIIKDNEYVEDALSRLTERFGRKVNITSGAKKGKLEIEFYNEEDLQQLVDFLL